MDVFNSRIYPNDNFAKPMIDKSVELQPHIKDDEYLKLVQEYEFYHLFWYTIFIIILFIFCSKINESLAEFKPDLIIYNAGTDILVGDPLGNLDISAHGIKSRDEILFKIAKERQIPIVMLTRFVCFDTRIAVIVIL